VVGLSKKYAPEDFFKEYYHPFWANGDGDVYYEINGTGYRWYAPH
jgi:hypothetical protein